MNSAEQAAGEKRVRQLLIEPLLRRGLAKPGSLSKQGFADMQDELCAKLAYMSDLNLAALEEEMAGKAGGKEKDRFPVGNKILEDAGRIQPPADDASPLIRAVFAASLGLDALAGGWAPELLADLREARRWPGSWAVKTIREKADDAVRQLRALDERLARGGDLSSSEVQWRQRRLALIAKCQRIADMGKTEGGAA